MNNHITTVRQGISELDNIARNAACNSSDQQMIEFMDIVAKVLDGLAYKVEKLEREVQPSSAFIDPNDIPGRLR
jgi:hypothetical protein